MTNLRNSAAVALALCVPGIAGAQLTALDRAPSHFASYSGIRVHYKSLGIGTTAVVFVHGWNSDLAVWRLQLPVVEGQVRALFVDLPGFGRSDKPPVKYTMGYLGSAVLAVMRSAGVDRAVLVGHSMGMPVIREVYRRDPTAVLGLVSVDGPLRSFFTDTAQARAFLSRFEGPDYASNVEQMFSGMVAPGTDSTIRAGIKRMARLAPQTVAVSAMREMLDPANWRDDVIAVPMLVVVAPNPNLPRDYEIYVKRLAPGVRYETIAGAGHFLMLDHPGEFNGMLTEFLVARKLLR